MQVRQLVAIAFNRIANFVRHMSSGCRSSKMPPVSRNRPYDQLAMTSAPTIADTRSIHIHPNPSKITANAQPDNRQHRYSGIRHHMHVGRRHIVAPVCRRRQMAIVVFLMVRVIVFGKSHVIFTACNTQACTEFMRLWYRAKRCAIRVWNRQAWR